MLEQTVSKTNEWNERINEWMYEMWKRTDRRTISSNVRIAYVYVFVSFAIFTTITRSCWQPVCVCASLTWTLTAQIIRFEIAFSTVLRQTHLHLHFRYIYAEYSVYLGVCVTMLTNTRIPMKLCHVPICVCGCGCLCYMYVFIFLQLNLSTQWQQQRRHRRQQTNCLYACNTTMNKKCHYV